MKRHILQRIVKDNKAQSTTGLFFLVLMCKRIGSLAQTKGRVPSVGESVLDSVEPDLWYILRMHQIQTQPDGIHARS